MENVFTLLRNKDHTAATLLGYESFFFQYYILKHYKLIATDLSKQIKLNPDL